MEILGQQGRINVSELTSERNKEQKTSYKFKRNGNYQQHCLIIYGAPPFKVEKLDQPQNVRATKCGRSYLPFPPSIKRSESNA